MGLMSFTGSVTVGLMPYGHPRTNGPYAYAVKHLQYSLGHQASASRFLQLLKDMNLLLSVLVFSLKKRLLREP